MLVVISDVHMTDRETGAPVTDTELTNFIQDIKGLKPQDEELTLLFLGDIIDFLRSEQWEGLYVAQPGAAPWTSLGQGFTGFEGSVQEKCLLGVADGVKKRYPAFAKALRELKSQRNT